MKISVIVTVLNEADTIIPLLRSLNKQTLLPDEVIIVDAGSTDRTVDKVRAFKATYNLRTETFKGVNRSQGRNRGIEMARNEIIAVIDAGCEAQPDWLKELGKEMERKGTTAAAGFYKVKARTRIEEIFGWFLAVDPEKFIADTYLPSSRSLMLTKKAWLKAGKYPEEMNTCEDLVFAFKLKALGAMTVNKRARVDWQMPQTYGQFFKQVAGYARGDIEAKFWPHLNKQISIWVRYLIFGIFPYLFLLYPGFIWWKFMNKIKRADWAEVIGVQLVADAAVMWGGISATATRLVKN